MAYQWSWRSFDDVSTDGVSTYLHNMFAGAGWSVLTALLGASLALAIGVAVGLMRVSERPLYRTLGAIYVEIFRDIPLLVQMFLWYFVFPELIPHRAGAWLKSLEYGPFYTTVVSLGLYTAARVAEQTRSAIASLPKGQMMASQALGLTRGDAYRKVVLPQAFRMMLPPLTSEMVNLMKNTSVGMTIGLLELTARARDMQESAFRVFEAFSAATLGYVAINLMIIGAFRYLERRPRLKLKNRTTPSAKEALS
ncbi:glutamate ABC transporter permease [Bordetella genomosp. 10]|uniref:Glutamate ABC transporter permease n=1 Tax=Bordetella genomosp. 10 TaxID=1416804 RepID=A0A261S4C8_9BORD|nr:amino acid ABC transporter permease [Bordetella genomosp. 10]OZI32209.1 glutamate ABC transporter permease [Bordetella genomosp. 10]